MQQQRLQPSLRPGQAGPGQGRSSQCPWDTKDAYRFDFIVAPMQPLAIPFLHGPHGPARPRARDMQLCVGAPFTKKFIAAQLCAPHPPHHPHCPCPTPRPYVDQPLGKRIASPPPHSRTILSVAVAPFCF